MIDFSVPEQTTRGFILNNAKLEIKMIEVVKTNCSGYFCDKQRSIEILKTDKKCGCYTMRDMGSNLAIVHVLKVTHETLYEDLQVDDFSSIKFSLLYLSEYFPKSTNTPQGGSSKHEHRYESLHGKELQEKKLHKYTKQLLSIVFVFG